MRDVFCEECEKSKDNLEYEIIYFGTISPFPEQWGGLPADSVKYFGCSNGHTWVEKDENS